MLIVVEEYKIEIRFSCSFVVFGMKKFDGWVCLIEFLFDVSYRC